MFSQLVALDERLSRHLAQLAETRPLLRRSASVLAHSGDSPIWVSGLLLVVWLGSAFWRVTAQVDLVGIAITALVVQVIKWRVRRPRPPGHWGQGYRRLDPHSFPSGHAARAVMLATVAVCLGPPGWALGLIIWSLLVAVARVVLRVHYLSDVVVGGLCGVVCGIALSLAVNDGVRFDCTTLRT